MADCPCLVCPRCGDEWHPDDREHPCDGLASCTRCHNEWWAHVGPHMDGRHIDGDLDEWREHDDAIWRANQ